MLREDIDGVALYRFEGLNRAEGVVHAVLTRIGGVSQGPYATLNLGHTVGDDLAAVEENHRRALRTLGLKPRQVVSPYQVHGARVGVVGRAHRGTVQPATDALVTAVPAVPLLMRFADCAPILLFDPVRRVVGMAHAGWRGVVAGTVEATIRTMMERLGCDPVSLWAGIGPTIGPCCYAVGPEIAAAVQAACPPGADVVRSADRQAYLDLPAAVEAQLRAAGVEQIEDAGLCTACHVDEFFSHRAEHGRTGRFGVVMELLE
ncbi:MAG: peptidoglycan editing factor PgeF [Chloroflexi bacterium]|nr:MAG: peptidoglycan editing factor PgeF [Chloroflexota bacterium]